MRVIVRTSLVLWLVLSTVIGSIVVPQDAEAQAKIAARQFGTRASFDIAQSAEGGAEGLESCEGSNGTKFWTDCDNANNAGDRVADADMEIPIDNSMGNHPIEFYINITTTGNGLLQIRALDVDEINEVRINNNLLGNLTGADSIWSDTNFTVVSSFLVLGDNLVRVDVDVTRPGQGIGRIDVDYGILEIN